MRIKTFVFVNIMDLILFSSNLLREKITLSPNIRVTDQDKFQQFSGMAGPAIKKYGGKVLARGPGADRLEGDVSGIVMMIEFESKEAANTFYHSEEYQAAKAVREECSDTDFMIIEGVAE